MAVRSRLEYVTYAVALTGFRQGTPLNVTTSPSATAALAEGIYDIWATEDCYIGTGPAAQFATLTYENGYLLRQGNTITIVVEEGDSIGAVTEAGSSTLRYHRVGVP